MARGRKPTPTAVLQMRGSWRANKRKGELKPDGDLPGDPPPWLTDDAATIYRRLASNEGVRSILTAADAFTLGHYADILATIQAAHAALDKDGMTVQGSTGQPVLHPAARIWAEAMDRALAAARELGLTPAGRVGLPASGTAAKLDPCFAL